MRNVGVEEGKVHFSGRKRGGDKRGIRDYLWEERELVNVLLKRANTHPTFT